MVAARSTREQLRRVTGPAAAPLLITDGAEVTDDAVWAWAQIPDACTYLLEDDDIDAATWACARALSSVLPPGGEFHLKTLRAPHTAENYRRSWNTVTSVRAPNAQGYIELGAHRIERGAATGSLRRKITLLGLKWGDDPAARDSLWTRLSRISPETGYHRQRTVDRRLGAARAGIDRWMATLGRSALRGAPAPAGLLAWCYARELRRTALPVPDAAVLTGAGLAALAHGRVDPTESNHYVVVTDLVTGARRYVSILVPAAITGFPAQDLSVPGGEWLEILGELDGVEASVRGINRGQVGSRILLDKALKVARSQIRESAITDGPPPPEALEAEQRLTERSSEIQHRVDVEITAHARWVVDAADPAELADRTAELQQRYDGIVNLQVIPDVQDLLFKELLPGDRVRVPEFGADQPMRTLAGSWFHGGSPFGDDTGPYMGVNRGSSADPVQIHIASRTEANKKQPTTVVFTGRSGSGKSTSLELCVLGLLAEAAWVLLTDVKGDLAGIVPAARQVLGVMVQQVNAVESSCSGTMDPMRFAPTTDEARTLTMDVLMGALSGADRNRGETVLEAAIDSVLKTPRPEWSVPAVIRALSDLTVNDANRAVGRELAATLAVRARTPQLRAVAGELAGGAQPLITGRGLIYLRLDGLDFPFDTPNPGQWSVPQRCSMATLRTALAYALHQSRRVRELKKVVALTELHLLTRYPEGAQFVDWLSRVGRALQTYLLLDTQSATDLSKVTGLFEQVLMAFCFQATGRPEQDAQSALLGRPNPGPQLRAAMAALGTGECVARDRHGRLTVMAFDRLTTGIAATLSTDAGDDHPNLLDLLDADTTLDAHTLSPTGSDADALSPNESDADALSPNESGTAASPSDGDDPALVGA